MPTCVLAFALCGCLEPYDPILICHNGNCTGSGLYADSSLEALEESLALYTDGRPTADGVELDTFLYYDVVTDTSRCLFAHDALTPDTSPPPMDAGLMLAEYLQNDEVSWNGERYYVKVELKPTVAGSDDFHTANQLDMHVQCVLDMVITIVEASLHPITVIFDSTAECLHNGLQDHIEDDAFPQYQALAARDDVEILYSGPIVPVRTCLSIDLDIRTFFVHGWRDTQIEGIRPVMVWLDAADENTESLKIIRYLRPEYAATSVAPFVRGWVTGFQ